MSNTNNAVVAGWRTTLTGSGRAGICSVNNDMGLLRKARALGGSLGRRYESASRATKISPIGKGINHIEIKEEVSIVPEVPRVYQ
jgi:hypothetical protein